MATKKKPETPVDTASEDEMAQAAARVLKEQRKAKGALEDDPADNPVRDPKPYKNLTRGP